MLKQNRFHSLLSLTAGLVVGAIISSFSVEASGFQDLPEATHGFQGGDPEASPDDIAREFGLPIEEGEGFGSNFGFSKSIPGNRVVAPEHFKDFRVNVDIFRKSTKRPVLGNFRDEYIDVLAPAVEGVSIEERREAAEKIFKTLAKKEFSLLSLDGVPTKAYIISGGLEARIDMVVKGANGRPVIDPSTGRAVTRKSMKSTPAGNYRLDPLYMKPSRSSGVKSQVAFPWIRSRSYNNSQMFWGLWIKGGYFIHSTPHYGELGRPASMGCIRQSFPDAMNLFKLIVEDEMPGMIRIQKVGSRKAVTRLRESVVDAEYVAPESAPLKDTPKDPTKDMVWLLGQLKENADLIDASKKYYGSEVEILGHAWMLPETGKPAPTAWPSCGTLEDSPIECFKTWRVNKPENSLN